MAAATAAFVLLAGLVLAGNALLGSGDEDAAEDTARDFMIAFTAEDHPAACRLGTAALPEDLDCAVRGEAAALSGDGRYRDIVTDITDFTVDLDDAAGTATVTCVIRVTPEVVRELDDLYIEASGRDSYISWEKAPPRVTSRIDMRKIGDRWLVDSYRLVGTALS
ncbi:hypothetical protein BJF79_24550 [Actinomadura sp. CNU-125]|nr:hypothetical protein BJF79_24550 [Actinomadura sp. CNU-125]